MGAPCQMAHALIFGRCLFNLSRFWELYEFRKTMWDSEHVYNQRARIINFYTNWPRNIYTLLRRLIKDMNITVRWTPPYLYLLLPLLSLNWVIRCHWWPDMCLKLLITSIKYFIVLGNYVSCRLWNWS